MLDLIDDDAAGENADWLADDVRPSMPLQPDGATEAGTPTIVPMTALSLKPVLRTDIPLIRDYPLPRLPAGHYMQRHLPTSPALQVFRK